HKISTIAEHLLNVFDFFVPVVNDVALYLHEVTGDELARKLLPRLEAIVSSTALDSQLVRFLIEWYIAQHPIYMAAPKLRGLVFGGPNIENQALAAIATKNIAWVRNHKAGV